MKNKYPYVAQQYQHLLNASLSNSQNSSIYGSLNQNQNPLQYGQPYSYNNQNPYGPAYSYGNPIQHNNASYSDRNQYSNMVYPANKYTHESYSGNQLNFNYPNNNLAQNNYFQSTNNIQNIQQTPTSQGQDDQKQIIHKVQYGDTLEGLSLIYQVSIAKIKQRNKIEGDSIYYLKEIIIPNPKANPMQTARNQHIYIQEFMAHMPFQQKSDKTARYYLEQHEWKVQQAIKHFKQDLQWQRKNNVQIQSIPLNQKSKGPYYNYQQLISKKSQ